MKAVIQRVSEASVSINKQVKSSIGSGLLILLGIVDSDKHEDIEWLCNKIANLRVFDDENGVMNLSIKDADGEIIVVSQFTLHASTKKGNRPSYIKAAKPDVAIPLYEYFLISLESLLGKSIGTGEFGAVMDVSLVNDGPVTIIIDTKNKE
ncbi:MAG: D-aminoacyl-tRNA deacylase [Bacteroidales bacterium]|jgi:D-tyrosyl-tRNA(Tyr) deacylase|nr:D-aminoacyl-tRNA deacylase [Bacteroidales bacterium]